MHLLYLSLFGCLVSVLSWSQAQAIDIESRIDSMGRPLPSGMIEVEIPRAIAETKLDALQFRPYRDRVSRWTHIIALHVDWYEPTQYLPDFSATDSFEEAYGKGGITTFGVMYAKKRNLKVLSIGPEFGISLLKVNSKSDVVDSTLEGTIFRVGARITFDQIFKEPYLAPYFTGGAYSLYYQESQANTAVHGFTEIAGYYSAGLMLQLNWILSEESKKGYFEAGVENSYLFAEAKQILSSGNDKDPEFGSELYLSVGFALEL